MPTLEPSVVPRAEIEAVKIVALASGVRIDPAVLRDLGGEGALTVHEYSTTGGITLELLHGVLLNAPFDEPYCEDSPLRLVSDSGTLILKLDDVVVPVQRVVPLPGYLGVVDDEGLEVRDTVMSHADRIRISPIDGCAFNCRFCDLAEIRYKPRPIEQLLSAIDIALEDRALPPTHLLISGGSPGRAPAQQRYFEDTCRAIARHVHERRPEGFGVDIMMTPIPDGAAFVERMVAVGVTGFSFNVEVYSDPAAAEHLPLKRKLSREHYEPTIQRAVELLGRDTGRVRSLIIPGLEPPEGTLAGVRWLAAMGCHPVLSPFRPARNTRYAAMPPVPADDLANLLSAAREITGMYGVALGPRCVACQHNTLTFPWDVGGLADE